MMSDKTLKAFVPARNAVIAKSFYRDLLGLELISEDAYGLDFDANGSLIRISIVKEYTPQGFTVLGWNVPDINAMIKLLNQRGIFCEHYGFPEQDSKGIWISPGGNKIAWFKDPDGNILSLTQ